MYLLRYKNKLVLWVLTMYRSPIMSNPIIIEGVQRSEEWFKNRLGVLTSSSCENIMTDAMRKTFVNKVLAEMLTGTQEPLPYSPHIEHGVKFEDEARRFYEIQNGKTVREVSFIFKDES